MVRFGVILFVVGLLFSISDEPATINGLSVVLMLIGAIMLYIAKKLKEKYNEETNVDTKEYK